MTTMNVPAERMAFITFVAGDEAYMPPKASAGDVVRQTADTTASEPSVMQASA